MDIGDIRRAVADVCGATIESIERGVWDVYTPDGWYWCGMETGTLILDRNQFDDPEDWQHELTYALDIIRKPLEQAHTGPGTLSG